VVLWVALDGELQHAVVGERGRRERMRVVLEAGPVDGHQGTLAGDELEPLGLPEDEPLDVVRDELGYEDGGRRHRFPFSDARAASRLDGSVSRPACRQVQPSF